jgi:hypothetical protein
MTSTKQIEANRRNSKASTGPVTENGKAVVAQNAIKHGLRSEAVVVVPEIEDAKQWEAHLAAILHSLHPVGYFETVLAERIAAQSWRLARAVRYETLMIQTSQEKVEEDLNELRRMFRNSRLGETHPGDIRGILRDALATQRAYKKLSDLEDDAPVKPEHAAGIVHAAFDAAECDLDVKLPGIPDDMDLYELAELDRFTAKQVRACVAAVAEAVKIDYHVLAEEIRDNIRLQVIQARMRAEENDRDVTRTRRERILPVGSSNHEKLQRYETTLERSLHRNLHELQRLQARREGGNVLSPIALDVDVSTGE